MHNISKAVAGADRKDLMKRLPKFIYDEEKALEEYDPSSLYLWTLIKFSILKLWEGSHLKTAGGASPTNLSFNCNGLGKLHLSSSRRPVVTVQASYRNTQWESFSSCVLSDGERPSSASIFVGGFILGGLVVGALGCVFAPQKTRKILTEKIAQLNSAIDDVSAQLRSEDAPNGVAVNSDEIETAI
ncbi:hypothetical protein GOBAR_AA05843 [Gossypium barbadense]|uniref:Uncharacterized protein n=1 Tax=Gossypium barbadense TaxID=3634 RepID=A0A2P5YGP0_GOSBA|nr:hypothetical protein GOBAR_AA05843 [Gossypium barbadense]